MGQCLTVDDVMVTWPHYLPSWVDANNGALCSKVIVESLGTGDRMLACVLAFLLFWSAGFGFI